jgi:hypothetical protein
MINDRCCLKTDASLRLSGDLLDPEAVTHELGIPPSSCHAKGDLRSSKVGPLIERTGVWALSSENALSSTILEHHIIYLLEKLEPVKKQLLFLMDRYSLTGDIFCGWFLKEGDCGGPEISGGVLRRIADLNLILDFDFYGPCGDD